MTEDTNHEMEMPTGNNALDTMGARIRAVRKARHLKLNATASEIGLSRTSLSQWESDEVENPDIKKLRAFSALVDVSLDWLIDRKGKDPEFLGVISPPSQQRRRKKGAPAVSPTETHAEGVASIAEIAPSLTAHARGIDHTARHHWTIPVDVLELGFNCNAGATVVKRVVTRDGKAFGLARGDYVLIDTSRNRFDEPGIYIVADKDGVSAARALVEQTNDEGELGITLLADDMERSSPQDNGDNLVVLGRVMGIIKPA